MKLLTTVMGVLGVFAAFGVSNAFAQDDDAPPATAKPVMVQMPDGTVKQGYAISTAEPKPEHKQMSFTFNPLNLFIGRYGFNFEYQPIVHHGLIITPHYDSASIDTIGYKDSFSGFAGEIGYRFYTGEKGFNGFFVSPQLLVGAYKSHWEGKDIFAGTSHDTNFTSLGYAIDIGGQGQIGGFVIGGGFGMQYTHVNKDLGDLSGTAAIIAGGGWRPRFLFNIGFAF